MIDNDIPQQTVLYYSKGYSIFKHILGLCLIGSAIGALLMSKKYNVFLILGALLFIVLGVFNFIKGLRQFIDKRAQVIIDNNGIKTVNTKFYEWSYIKNDEVIAEGQGRFTTFYLVYDYPEGTEKLLINDYPIDQPTLIKLLRTYRGRYNKK